MTKSPRRSKASLNVIKYKGVYCPPFFKSFKYFLITINFATCFLINNLSFASPYADSAFLNRIAISSVTERNNGVLVARSDSLDLQILDIITKNNINSIDDYSYWLQKSIIYRSDGVKDEWSTVQETLQRGYGDCDDFAFLTDAVLKVLGYETKVLAMGGLGGGHAVCVCKENDYYVWFDNAAIQRTSTKSLPEFAKYIFSEYEYDYSFILEIHNNNKSKEWNILFTKSDSAETDSLKL